MLSLCVTLLSIMWTDHNLLDYLEIFRLLLPQIPLKFQVYGFFHIVKNSLEWKEWVAGLFVLTQIFSVSLLPRKMVREDS